MIMAVDNKGQTAGMPGLKKYDNGASSLFLA